MRSTEPPMELIAVRENGQLKLDMRGAEKLGFLRQCNAAGSLSAAGCRCTFAWMRAQEMVPEPNVTPTILRAVAQDSSRCRRSPDALPY